MTPIPASSQIFLASPCSARSSLGGLKSSSCGVEFVTPTSWPYLWMTGVILFGFISFILAFSFGLVNCGSQQLNL